MKIGKTRKNVNDSDKTRQQLPSIIQEHVNKHDSEESHV